MITKTHHYWNNYDNQANFCFALRIHYNLLISNILNIMIYDNVLNLNISSKSILNNRLWIFI